MNFPQNAKCLRIETKSLLHLCRCFSSRGFVFLCHQGGYVCKYSYITSVGSAGGKLQLNVHTPVTQRNQIELTILCRHSWEPIRYELTRNSSRNAGPYLNTRGQLVPERWTISKHSQPFSTAPGLNSGTGVHQLNSTFSPISSIP